MRLDDGDPSQCEAGHQPVAMGVNWGINQISHVAGGIPDHQPSNTWEAREDSQDDPTVEAKDDALEQQNEKQWHQNVKLLLCGKRPTATDQSIMIVSQEQKIWP